MIMRTAAHNPYVEMMYRDYKAWVYDENAKDNKGLWRERAFASGPNSPLDLEIGTGNGTHFAHRALQNPDRLIVGLELKYKTLVQSIRRAVDLDAKNARMVRYPAEELKDFFAPAEINDVFIFFPDPWPKRRQQKNRLIKKQFLSDLFDLMAPGSRLFFKTDDWSYFRQASRLFAESSFTLTHYTEDLHRSFVVADNFVTQFESVFIKKGQPIFACQLIRP